MWNVYNQILLVSRSFLLSFTYLFRRSLFKHYLKLSIYYFIMFIAYLFFIFGLTKITVDSEFIQKIPFLKYSIFQFLLSFLLFFNYFLLFLSVYKFATITLISPFLGEIAEHVYIEKMKRNINVDMNKRYYLFRRAIKVNSRIFFWESFFGIILFFIRLFDITFISYIISFLLSAYYVGFSFMDFGLELYQKTSRETKFFVQKYKYMAMAIGIVYISFLFVPIIGFILAAPICLTLGVNTVINIIEDEYKNILPKVD